MDRPLPYGWISQVDQNSGHKFYVDTKATPPRSIWVHPLEDEQYLREHPEAREKARLAADDNQPQYSAPTTPPVGSPATSSSQRTGYAAPAGSKPEKRGLFSKLKDATVGTKEEREQEKRHKAEQKRQMLELRERRHQEMLAQQAAMYQQQQQQQEMYARQNPQYQQQFAPQYGYAPQQTQRSGFGGGGMAMPLLGGLAGGLLLGDVLGGGFDGGDGGGFDGGDGGGGDF